MECIFKIAGKAGAGVMVTGRSLIKCFTRGGYNAIGYPEYPSLIRGGHNTVQVRVSDREINSPLQRQELVIALNKDAVFYHMGTMAKGGIMIYDELIDISQFSIREDVRMYPLPLAKLTKEAGGSEKMKNTAALGAALAAVAYPFNVLEGILKDEFGRKGEDVVKMNISTAKAGYDYVRGNGIKTEKKLMPLSDRKDIAITGNEAIALGAVAGGMKFYAAYPMTPASSILHYLATKEREFSLVVKQTEDEIAAINYAIGASFAGVRSMVGTSGGGFALMTEALGSAALSETPLVVVIAQRIGPSTGMPTWTEQADLKFALNASQGDFPRVVLAPGNIEEAFLLTAKAHNLAEKYQIPVIVLTDKHLSETVFSTPPFDQGRISVERGKIAKNLKQLPANERWKRYAFAKDGVSERALPGEPNGMHVATSYEHDETGYSSESFVMRTKQVDKRASKIAFILKEMDPPESHGKKDAEVVMAGWGSTKLAALDAIPILEKNGIKARYVHFSHLFPLDKNTVQKAIGKAKATIMIENNSSAQFAGILKEHADVDFNFHLLKYDGRPFFPEQIAEELASLKKAGFKGAKEIRICEKEDLEYYNPQRHGL